MCLPKIHPSIHPSTSVFSLSLLLSFALSRERGREREGTMTALLRRGVVRIQMIICIWVALAWGLWGEARGRLDFTPRKVKPWLTGFHFVGCHFWPLNSWCIPTFSWSQWKFPTCLLYVFSGSDMHCIYRIYFQTIITPEYLLPCFRTQVVHTTQTEALTCNIFLYHSLSYPKSWISWCKK